LPQDSGGAGRVFNVFAISNVRFTSIRDIRSLGANGRWGSIAAVSSSGGETVSAI
jgi:hypothetical protein